MLRRQYMKEKALLGSRLLFGLAFVVFGLNGFFNFMANPPMAPEAGALMGAFAKTGYFFPMIKIVEIVAGALLLSGFFVPFALALIFPILIGITSIHLFLNPGGLPIMIVFHLLHGFLVYGYWKNFKSVMVVKA